MADEDHHQLQDELGVLIQERNGAFLTRNDEMDDEDVETPTAGVLTGWFLVCQWVGDDGGKWLSYHSDNNAATWETRGLLSEALSDLP